MYEAAKIRFRSLIENELAGGGTKDRGALDAIFSRLDATAEKLIAGKGLRDEQAVALRAALADAKAEHVPDAAPSDGPRVTPPELIPRLHNPRDANRPPAKPPGRSLGRWVGGGLVAAAVVGAILLVPDIAAALQPSPAKPNPHLASFQARLDASSAPVRAVTAYLWQVRKAVERRQKADPVALTALTGGGWVSLKAIEPKLFARKPKVLPRKTDISVRAVGDGYKVLLKTALCTDAKYIKPAYVDPKRDLKSAGCEYLAVWNKAGAGL